MRLRSPLTAFIAILVLALFALIASRVLHFIGIFGAHAGPLLTQEEIEAAYNGADHKSRQEYVPRILHQIFHNWADPGNETLPTDWDVTRKTCIDANPDFEYRVRLMSRCSCATGHHNADCS
jgi:mannosyltransferase OCH1-like enzyme